MLVWLIYSSDLATLLPCAFIGYGIVRMCIQMFMQIDKRYIKQHDLQFTLCYPDDMQFIGHRIAILVDMIKYHIRNEQDKNKIQVPEHSCLLPD